MKVNIIIGESDSKWILGRLAKELHEHLGWSINKKGADIDYCVPYLIYERAKAPIMIPLLTHREPGKQAIFDKVSNFTKFAVCMSEETRIKSRFKAIHFASDLNKNVVFGTVGKNHASGRKNFHWVEELRKEFTMLHKVLGADKEERQDFYNKIDYLVITSSIEGGPMPVLDAIAMGVPVIAPNVGWCWNYPCFPYRRGDLESLKEVMRQFTPIRTWKTVAEDHLNYFKKVYEKGR